MKIKEKKESLKEKTPKTDISKDEGKSIKSSTKTPGSKKKRRRKKKKIKKIKLEKPP